MFAAFALAVVRGTPFAARRDFADPEAAAAPIEKQACP